MSLAAEALTRIISIDEMEESARALLPHATYDYFAGGAEDEATVRANREAFAHHRFAYHVLGGAGAPALGVDVLGRPISMPVLLAPTGMQRMAHPEGELAVARGAARAGTVYCVSTMATHTLEDVAAASDGPKWFQLYVCRDRGLTTALVDRAVAAAYEALVITVDTPMIGRRERDLRNGFTMPPGLTFSNLQHAPEQGRPGVSGLARDAAVLFDPAIGWADLEWLVQHVTLPVIVKGIVRPDDAARAVDAGAAGIYVSNHGGRQLDHAVGTLEALPAVVEAVGTRAMVLLDGGVRRGTDVVKALALGAAAVTIGRPYLWGLAVGGEAGVGTVLELLRQEISLTMTLLGARTVAEIRRDVLA